MKVIITGGSGLLGRGLTANLASDGYEVIILSRSPGQVRGLPPGARAVGWDAESARGWGHQAEGAAAIVNLAGYPLDGPGFLPSRWTARRKQMIRQSRLDAGAAVVEAVQQAEKKPGVVLQSSAVGYYGPRYDERLDESAAAGDDFLAQVCVDWEASTAAVVAEGVPRAVLRTGLPLTEDGGAFPLLKLPFTLFVGGPFGDGQQYYSWLHYDDHIRAMRFLIDARADGAYNLTAPNPVTNREFAQTLGRVMRRPSWLPAPAFAMKLALGEVSTVVLDGQRVLPQRLLDSGFHFDYPELEPALKEVLGK
jgi:uncharacterized protein (TIGR01777 family)